MKQKWSKRLSAIAAAILILMVGILPVSAAETVQEAKEMGATYFQKLESAADKKLTGTPSLKLQKYASPPGDPTASDTSKPIDGVVFKYAKVGGLYQLTLEDAATSPNRKTTVMAYGVTTAFAQAVGLSNPDYTHDGYYFYKDGAVIQNATRGKTVTDLEEFLGANNVKTGTTDGGVINAQLGTNSSDTNPYGLYLVAEYNVEGATQGGKPISITQRQNPFVVSLPTQNGAYWNEDVVANVKNSTGVAEVEKKIVVGDNEMQSDGKEDVADTDITSIGDTVHFRLKGTILPIPNTNTNTSTTTTESIQTYILTDFISKGLTPVKGNDGAVKIDAVRVVGGNGAELGAGDYTVSAPLALTGREDGYTADFAGGQQFTITFTPAGVQKLTKIAKTSEATKAVYFYYSATVKENAVIGPQAPADGVTPNSGNPNKVKLDYRVSGSRDMTTDWDTVTEFTFGLDVTKQFEGTPPVDTSAVTFKLYSSTDNGATKKYYTFTGTDGDYTTPTVAANASAATALKLDANKLISIKGLEEGTYYVEEIATVAGYNLLKEPVKMEIKAKTGANTYVDPGSSSDYLGTTDTSTTGTESVTIINTQGFQLPATGGAGIWMFVLGGILVIGMGCVYFVASKRKKN